MEEFYFTLPAEGLAEGEIDLRPARPDVEEMVIHFSRLLLEKTLPDDGWQWSAFSIEWSQALPQGRLYGQAWPEREGTTVHFGRFRLIDTEGRLIATGSATAHRS